MGRKGKHFLQKSELKIYYKNILCFIGLLRHYNIFVLETHHYKFYDKE